MTGMKLPTVSAEAQQIIHDYVAAVDKKLNEFSFDLEDWHRRQFLLNVEHSWRLYSMMLAQKRGSASVESVDAKKTISHATPEMLVRHALGTSEQHLRQKKIADEHFKLLSERMKSLRERQLLDAGCGWGRQLVSYRERGMRGDYFGVDINPMSIRYGKAVAPDAHFVAADIQYLPFRNQCFDAVVCLAVVSRVKHRQGTKNSIREFSRVLKPEGLFELLDSFTENWLTTQVLNLAARIFRVILPEIGHFCQLNNVKEFLNLNGFVDIKAERVGPTAAPLLFGNLYSFLATRG
jgi:ubiquinone/menaquinone biosynthesis C-methylase UbiE